MHATARWLVSQPDTDDWIYRGKEDAAGPDLITVEMPDRSRRVLRDRDVRASNLTWGYTGTGPHNLASVLLADILAGHQQCPDCFGVIMLVADIIVCGACSNSGMRPGTMQAKSDLLTKVIGKLPEEFKRTRLELLHTVTGI